MTASPPTEFTSTDGYYQPESGGLLFSLSPMMAGGMLLLLVLAVLIGWWMGQRRRPSDDPCEAIYDDVRKAINTAAGASRDSVIIAGRKLQSTLQDRLGAVLKLADGLHAPGHGLAEALEGMGSGHTPHGPDKATRPDPSPTRFVIKARDVVFHSHEAAKTDGLDTDRPGHSADHDDHAADHDVHEAGHVSRHGEHGHGHARPLDAPTQIANVRAAVHALSDHWNDRAARLAELRVARRQLTGARADPGSGAAGSGRVWDRR